MNLLIIIGVVLLVVGVIIWIIYNGLVQAQNVVEEAFSGIDVQLKKRYELIPNLIEAVKGYNAHEAQTLQNIVESRSNVSSLSDIASKDANITSHLKQFRIIVEDYPELKANNQFVHLMENLTDVEQELSLARRYYNGTVREYNIKVQSFPNSIIAGMFSYKEMAFYKIGEGEDAVPEINLNKN